MYVTPETEGRFGHRPKYWEDIPEFFQLEKRVEDKARARGIPPALLAVEGKARPTLGLLLQGFQRHSQAAPGPAAWLGPGSPAAPDYGLGHHRD